MKIKKKFEPIVSGASAALVISILAYLTLETSSGIWLMFSFGATVFIVFVLYNLDTAQPKNIFFGHLVSITVGIVFNELVGLSIVILFAWILGFGATLAEPALNALGLTVQELTNGAFKKSMLMYSVAGGVAFGIALGVGKIVFGFDLATVLLPLYLLAVVLTYFSTEEFVNVAWDSAGVTTGPVTVPLVLAMGLGLGNAVSATEGFGILSMASICPILAVLLMGLFIQIKQKNKKKE